MVTISFNYDETTQKITNLKVIPLVTPSVEEPVIMIEQNRLVLSDAAMNLLEVKPNDRISISYWQVDNQCTFPVIGKPECFTDVLDGNRITKSKTISFRGQQHDLLVKYVGNMCRIVKFEDHTFFKLEKYSTEETKEDLQTEVNELNSLNDFNLEENI